MVWIDLQEAETGPDTAAGRDNDKGFEEVGDVQDSSCRSAPGVDVCWWVVDEVGGEVAGFGDDDGVTFSAVGP